MGLKFSFACFSPLGFRVVICKIRTTRSLNDNWQTLCIFMFTSFKTISVFVYKRYELQAYTVNLNYQSTLLNTVEEISMVVIGPFFNIVLFCFLVIFSWAIQRLFGTSPNIFSRFIMAYGVNVLLDPIWILIVDSALMRSVYLYVRESLFAKFVSLA